MTNRKCVFGLALFAMASLAPSARAADQYNFFARARYPGLAKAPGVDIYKVQQTGGDHATATSGAW